MIGQLIDLENTVVRPPDESPAENVSIMSGESVINKIELQLVEITNGCISLPSHADVQNDVFNTTVNGMDVFKNPFSLTSDSQTLSDHKPVINLLETDTNAELNIKMLSDHKPVINLLETDTDVELNVKTLSNN